jgi:ABC-type antimicrobial peptide transport system permease subunit
VPVYRTYPGGFNYGSSSVPHYRDGPRSAGVMSYYLSQRRREIGIRVAIGAARGQVLGLVMRQGLRTVVLGTGNRPVGAVLGARLVRGILYGSSGIDVATLAGVPAVLIAVAAVAIWVPARRAATVDPMVALRGE